MANPVFGGTSSSYWKDENTYVGYYECISNSRYPCPQESQDNTINDIIDNSSLTPSQKTEAIKQYLGLQEDKTGDKITEILPWILALVVVIFVMYFITTNKKR
jgi:hypothetical protein